MPFWGQVGLQGSYTLVGRVVSDFYKLIMLIMFFIFCLVMCCFVILFLNRSYFYNKLLRSESLEFWWTLFPIYIVVLMVGPSLFTLYFMDEVNDSSVTVKVVGHQWYWSYEYSDYGKLNFDSYMLPEDSLSMSRPFRLLEVDNRMIVPASVEVRVVITSADVMHAWAVPGFGVKVDAIPGRLNQVGFTVGYTGIFFGQCSEICGANHAFMPICVEVVPNDEFINLIQHKVGMTGAKSESLVSESEVV